MFGSIRRACEAGFFAQVRLAASDGCLDRHLIDSKANRAAFSPWRLPMATAAVLVVGLGLTGCGPKTEQELIAAAKAHIDKQENAAAIVQLKASLQQQPQSAQARYLLGTTLLKTGNASAAVVELEKARELKHSDEEVLPPLARALVADGRAKRVTVQYAGTTLNNPRAMAELSAAVAAAYAAQGNTERSEAATARALQADPKNSEARLLHARLKSGRGQADEAQALIDALIADEPRNRDAWYFKGEFLLKAGRPDDAVPALKQALAIEPKYLMAHNALIDTLLRRRNIPEFRARVQQMQAALPGHPDTRYFEATVALFDKEFAKARGIMRELLREIPENPRLLQMAGAIELTAGAVTMAETYLLKAVQLQPRLMPARRLLAEAYLRGDQPARALATLRPLLDHTPDAETLALAGEAYFQNGQLQESEAYLIRAASASPDDLRIRTAMALTKIAKGNAESGISDLESLAATNPSTYVDLALVSVRLRRNDLAGALKDLDRLQTKLPDGALPHHLRGRIQTQMKDVAAARASFDKAVAADPSYVPAVASLATLDVADKRIDLAIKRFESLLVREPGSYRAVLAIAELKQAAGASPEEIRNLLSQAIKASPGELAPRVMLVDYLLAHGDIAGAGSAAQEALTMLPDDPRAFEALGRAQLAAGDHQQAIGSFTKAASLQPGSATVQLWLARAQLAGKDVISARRSLQRALEIDPTLLPARTALVQVALAQKNYEEALALARTIQKQRPADPVGHLLEAEILTTQQRWDPAIAALRAAMERQKPITVATRMHATLLTAGKASEAEQFSEKWLRENPTDVAFLSYLGAVAMDRRLFAESESRYRAVLALDANNVNALNNVAWAMTQQGKKGALPLAEKANKLSPNQPGLMDTLAEAMAGEGRFVEAIELQRRAMARAGDHPEYRLHLAKLLIASGDRTAARSELVVLAKLGEKFPRRAEAVKLLQTL